MTQYEYLLLTRDVQKVNRYNSVNPDDIDNLETYSRYLKLMAKGLKMGYIMALISVETGITERSLYRMIVRMKRQISLDCLLPKGSNSKKDRS